ncbi:nitric oxide-sensing protein NosP [Chitinimonas sp.]|uniref:nitric oxide-sensing protein NosP n=1 Tax=Chitinimonas sp. TaxID=1934313 RepID=UPI002F944425
MMGRATTFRSTQTSNIDPVAAAQEFHAGVFQPDMELVLFFCSSHYHLPSLAQELNHLFQGVRLVGCTTAGEIGPAGYLSRGITGLSLSKGEFCAELGLLEDLQGFSDTQGQAHVHELLQRFERRAAEPAAAHPFAFLLIDGLSMREEVVSRCLQNSLGRIPLVGGSAGDDLKFERTYVFYQGRFRSNCALLALISSVHPTRIFKTQHFTATEERLVVTAADTSRRVVYEINGLPAAQEYARLVGVPVEALSPALFAANPIAVVIDGTEYVRSIQKAGSDGSLTFYCAMDEGLVLRITRGGNLMHNLTQSFRQIKSEIGEIQLVLGCDCILRNLEISQSELKRAVGEVFRLQGTVGFSTYGEQYHGVHVNQTFTGVAIGYAKEQRHG